HWLHSEPMKDAGLRIRVQRDLREKFIEVCRAQDKPAAQVLREFMREYVAQHDTSAGDTDQNSEGVALERAGSGNRQG
ncbi:hypothetical protein MNBD_GAMMA09-3329, partial [hydrothermal vent metagenome]